MTGAVGIIRVQSEVTLKVGQYREGQFPVEAFCVRRNYIAAGKVQTKKLGWLASLRNHDS